MKKHVVFVHGWGVNAGIWSHYISRLESVLPDVQCHAIDLPGYGGSVDAHASDQLSVLAQFCLDQAPDDAVWVGWSLGGMVTIQAALALLGNESTESVKSAQGVGFEVRERQCLRIRAMQLIATTPCFVAQSNGAAGVEEAVFQRFSNELAHNYRAALSTFLLLQSGTNKAARLLAKAAHSAVCDWPSPSERTLQLGIDCLARADLRAAISDHAQLRLIPTQVVACELDRIANPVGSEQLAALMQAQLLTVRSGHAPFLTNPDLMLSHLQALIVSAYG